CVLVVWIFGIFSRVGARGGSPLPRREGSFAFSSLFVFLVGLVIFAVVIVFSFSFPLPFLQRQ
ncbi:MAG TPA: hypothetical protein VLA51_01625, partial [Paracoccaceae bacterium]|nr:hypothetical protein [Paracoccaceae bacterium]